jgi:hypothetical protein
MKTRQAIKIHKRWLLTPPWRSLPLWKQSTLDLALELRIHRRFLPGRVAGRGW